MDGLVSTLLGLRISSKFVEEGGSYFLISLCGYVKGTYVEHKYWAESLIFERGGGGDSEN